MLQTLKFSEENTNSFNNDVDETVAKCAIMENSKHYGYGNKQWWAQNKRKRKRQHLDRIGNTKKLENHECSMAEEREAGRKCTLINSSVVTKRHII